MSAFAKKEVLRDYKILVYGGACVYDNICLSDMCVIFNFKQIQAVWEIIVKIWSQMKRKPFSSAQEKVAVGGAHIFSDFREFAWATALKNTQREGFPCCLDLMKHKPVGNQTTLAAESWPRQRCCCRKWSKRRCVAGRWQERRWGDWQGRQGLSLLAEETGRNTLEKMDEQSCAGDLRYNKFLKLKVKKQVVDKFKRGMSWYGVLQWWPLRLHALCPGREEKCAADLGSECYNTREESCRGHAWDGCRRKILWLLRVKKN